MSLMMNPSTLGVPYIEVSVDKIPVALGQSSTGFFGKTPVR